MKKLLITGGAGFIGSEFVRQGVKRGYEIIVVDKITYAGDMERIKEIEKDVRFYKGDILNRDFIGHVYKTENPDIVVHWAAESHVDRSILDAVPFLETNVLGTHILLETSRAYDVKRFINISTDEVYGELGKNGQFYETTAINPNSPYSASKASADMLGRAYHKTFGLPVITVRPSNNYGPWQYPEKLVPVVILKALNDEKIPIYGKGENVREWLFVSDCVDAVFLIMEKGEAGDTYNVGSGEERKNTDVAEYILKLLGKPKDIIQYTTDRLGHDYRYSLNSEKIKKCCGWQAKVSFNQGMEETIKWYKDNTNWVNSNLERVSNYWKMVYK